MVQLKKNNFLAVITEKPMTKKDVVDALDAFDFIPSWLDYLIAHFEDQGKIIKTGKFHDGDGTIQRKAGKGAAGPRNVYLVKRCRQAKEGEPQNCGFKMVERVLKDDQTMDKDIGEATTAKRAVKNMSSTIFAKYKEETAAVRTLIEADGDVADSPDSAG